MTNQNCVRILGVKFLDEFKLVANWHEAEVLARGRRDIGRCTRNAEEPLEVDEMYLNKDTRRFLATMVLVGGPLPDETLSYPVSKESAKVRVYNKVQELLAVPEEDMDELVASLGMGDD